jgi:hypothetical protein
MVTCALIWKTDVYYSYAKCQRPDGDALRRDFVLTSEEVFKSKMLMIEPDDYVKLINWRDEQDEQKPAAAVAP